MPGGPSIFSGGGMSEIGDTAQLIAAIVLAFNCLQSWRNGRKADKIAADVATIEVATNSMKDALVAATAKAAMAEGTAVGLAQGRQESDDRNASRDVRPEEI